MKISTQSISRVLHGTKFLLLANTSDIEYYMYEIHKVKCKKIDLEDKLTYFKWMAGVIIVV